MTDIRKQAAFQATIGDALARAQALTADALAATARITEQKEGSYCTKRVAPAEVIADLKGKGEQVRAIMDALHDITYAAREATSFSSGIELLQT